MTEEEAQQLRKEHAELKEEVARKDRRIEELEGLLLSALLRIEELERRLAKDSHNSSKPPSSDGPSRKQMPRPTSSQPKGGQPGHRGHALPLVETPDQVITHRPSHCEACHCELGEAAGQVKERRQIHELPVLRLEVTEHQVEVIDCPVCHHLTAASFPVGVNAPAQYGPRVQALAVYLSQYQLLPMERIGEVLEDLLGCPLSDGTLANWTQEAARTLGPTMHILKRLLLLQKLDHVDETGGRVKGLLHWFHVNATQWLTLYHWHRQRGQKAMDAIGILPQYSGRAIHDRLSSYDHYGCAHSVCGAHLLRDCLLIAERDHQPWAQQMHDLLRSMSHITARFRVTGAHRLPQGERDALVLRYFEILQQGFALHRMLAPPPDASAPKKTGRRKQDDAKNLLDALLARAEQVLAFLDDLAVPISPNQAERDLRMIKVQQKISGTFRSAEGATAFCVIRSYLSTMRKQGRSMLAAMTAVFEGSPFSIAWEPGT
ncbi:IS66 family transposase [Ktedonobacter racemifer]|uniref:Transposase n=1 Tax=Ktedonobacter racemifer DSM 44963 TaxID=485913 RepID=D6TY60_KTERA|nr:IS66 family transposase [Ktedonobacter racemifer]EFH85056.1 transposase [Ktedonobacter racemifer DSM 44963]